MSTDQQQIKTCLSNHPLKYRPDTFAYWRCKTCNQSCWGSTTYYECGQCQGLYFCEDCYNLFENQTQLSWLILCNNCQCDVSVANTNANANAICLVYGYFRLNDTINTKIYSYQDISIICLQYFWEFYKAKVFYDKYYPHLVSPNLLHLRPLIDAKQIDLIKYILNHTKSKYINNVYTINDTKYGSILWEIVSHKKTYQNEEIFSDENIKQFCSDYHIDINKHFKGIFTNVPAINSQYGRIRYEYATQRTVKALYSLFNKQLNIDWVDHAIDNKWFGITTFLINKGCKITQKCYNQYFVYLIQNHLDKAYKYKTMDVEDLYKVYNDKDECFKLALAMKPGDIHSMSNNPEIAMAELVYNKFNKDININYTNLAIERKHSDLFVWMINHGANIDVDDIYNNWYDIVCKFDAIPVAQCFYDKFEGNINMNYVSDVIKKNWTDMFEWMVQHKVEVTDKHWLQIINSSNNIRWKHLLDVLYEREQNIDPIIDCIDIAIKENKWKLAKWMIQHGVHLKEDSFDNIFTSKAINNNNYDEYNYWRKDGNDELEFAKTISEINPDIIRHSFQYYRDLLIKYEAKWGQMSYWLFIKIYPTKYKYFEQYIDKYFEQYIDLYFRYFAETKRDKATPNHLIKLIIEYYPHPNTQHEKESFEIICESIAKHDKSLDDP